jgi:pterin-4a-carbinolamine dehydratase
MSTTILWQWEHWGDIIMIREQFNVPDYMEGFEFIVNEMVKESESRGFSADVPESYGGYAPMKKKVHNLHPSPCSFLQSTMLKNV